MAAIPSTVDIDCPRPSCEDHVTCALETVQLPPKPGAKPSVSVRITDLADRMAEHYAAQHPTVYGVNVGIGQRTGTLIDGLLEQFAVSGDLAANGMFIAPRLGDGEATDV